ncbi:MAG TPA: DUF2341 domain-containing protein [Planctomycetota bacterium]|nr:DUF2341 domain-containing protein [Planctomycetota bacterium]
MSRTRIPIGVVLLTVLLAQLLAAEEPYQGWRHSGSIFILTTPEGANLPASASEEGFPLLVRLHKDFFNFTQAKANGEDIRFSSNGTPLPFQLDDWDAASGTASVWVRIPTIKGNARQEIKMHWGKADAASESSGATVFNASNGYLSVWHMNDPVKDDAGALESKNAGTTATAGMIGAARHFAGKQGISCGENIAGYPVGSASHSTEAWFRAEQPNATIIGWGNEHAQGKVVLQFVSPPHIRADCYFSNGNVESANRLAASEWVHVVHAYQNGDTRIYVNGRLDGTNGSKGSPQAIKSPARLWIGGWYNNYSFVGDIDEVRLSNVARSADWVRLQYENQKRLQTLTGPLVQAGTAFSVSKDNLSLMEGSSTTITAEAGGAQKVYWTLKRHGNETIAAVDRFTFTFDAGRVSGDQAVTLEFKAIYANEVKKRDIAIQIKEAIPDPAFTLKAPSSWDGRETIEISPQFSNMIELQAKGAAPLNYSWSVSNIAVIKNIAPGKLILERAQNSGTMTVTATISNGGKPVTQSALIVVTEPKSDPWVERTPAKDEKPEDGQFYARNDKNEGTLYYNGTLNDAADSVFLKVYADEQPYKTESSKLTAEKAYSLSVKLKPGLIKYKVEFGASIGGKETVLQTVNNIVCGDAYLINGQSNALATDTREISPPETNEWIRSYGRPPANTKEKVGNLWCNPVWKAQKGEKEELGWWGMELAKRLLESQKVPIFIINAAVGGTRIDQHQRNETDPVDLSTIYGRMLWRVQQARLTHGIRGILWHQGENNQGTAGPTGDFDWKSYEDYFVNMSAGWKRDFPNVQHYYVFQIWPNACGMAGKTGAGDMIREIQRSLPRLYSHMSVMSTLGVKPADGCHFPLAGWAEFARLIQPLIERDHYGKVPAVSITPPNLRNAAYASNTKDTIVLEFDQPVVWADSLAGQFYLDGEKDKIASGSVSGNVLTLKLREVSAAKKITYLKEIAWNQDTLLKGANGIAALTFSNVPISFFK